MVGVLAALRMYASWISFRTAVDELKCRPTCASRCAAAFGLLCVASRCELRAAMLDIVKNKDMCRWKGCVLKMLKTTYINIDRRGNELFISTCSGGARSSVTRVVSVGSLEAYDAGGVLDLYLRQLET